MISMLTHSTTHIRVRLYIPFTNIMTFRGTFNLSTMSFKDVAPMIFVPFASFARKLWTFNKTKISLLLSFDCEKQEYDSGSPYPLYDCTHKPWTLSSPCWGSDFDPSRPILLRLCRLCCWKWIFRGFSKEIWVEILTQTFF